MSNALITIDENNATLSAFQSIDAVYTYINEALGRYSDLAGLTFKWEKGKSLSKMVAEAQDGAGIAKAERSAQFRKIRAIFINEGLNDLLEAMFRKLGGKGQFAGVTKNGVANFKFVPQTLANGKRDAVLKEADAIYKETVANRTVQSAKEQGFDVLPDGTLVRRLTE